MKKSEMKAKNIKTASLQRLFRGRWHKPCVFDNGSDLQVLFGQIKPGQEKEWYSLCSNCLIDKHKDTGHHFETKGEDEQ